MITIKHIRNTFWLASAAWIISSCDQIATTTPNSIDGEWKCEEKHYELGTSNYYINIEYADSQKTAIKIYNFNNLSGYCKANVSGSSISIPQQVVDKHTVSGSGSIASDKKSLSFNYNDDAFGDGGGNVTTKCTRIE